MYIITADVRTIQIHLFTGIKKQKNGLQVLNAINLLNSLMYLIFQK